MSKVFELLGQEWRPRFTVRSLTTVERETNLSFRDALSRLKETKGEDLSLAMALCWASIEDQAAQRTVDREAFERAIDSQEALVLIVGVVAEAFADFFQSQPKGAGKAPAPAVAPKKAPGAGAKSTS